MIQLKTIFGFFQLTSYAENYCCAWFASTTITFSNDQVNGLRLLPDQNSNWDEEQTKKLIVKIFFRIQVIFNFELEYENKIELLSERIRIASNNSSYISCAFKVFKVISKINPILSCVFSLINKLEVIDTMTIQNHESPYQCINC